LCHAESETFVASCRVICPCDLREAGTRDGPRIRVVPPGDDAHSEYRTQSAHQRQRQAVLACRLRYLMPSANAARAVRLPPTDPDTRIPGNSCGQAMAEPQLVDGVDSLEIHTALAFE